MGIVIAVLMFCLLIFVHELGHFVVAKAVGIRVHEFSLGMGPQLFHFQKGETMYSLRAFPIGGYVRMEGEDEESTDERAFNNKPAWAKAGVVVAGSFMNLVTTIVIMSAIFLVLGNPNQLTNTIYQTTPGYPAEAAGLQAGDTIVEIDGQPVSTWDHVTSHIWNTSKDEVALVVQREGERLFFTSKVLVDNGKKLIGISPAYEKQPEKALLLGFQSTADMTKQMLGYLSTLFQGKGSMKDLTGPVGIVYIVEDSAKQGFLYLANLTALISLNLAIVNLLPLPALDGGRLLFLGIRLATGRIVTDELEGRIHMIGMVLLLGLMLYITFQDIGRFVIQ